MEKFISKVCSQFHRNKITLQDEQHGFVGISVYTLGFIPLTNTEKDRAASQRARDFFIGW